MTRVQTLRSTDALPAEARPIFAGLAAGLPGRVRARGRAERGNCRGGRGAGTDGTGSRRWLPGRGGGGD